MKSNIELNSNALKMRKRLGEDSSSPMDIFALINNNRDITLVFYPMSERISGICVKEKRSKIIAINSNMSYGRQRFTAAHELYHLFFEDGVASTICEKNIDSRTKSESEKEADRFASYLLVPYDSLKEYIEENKMEDKDITVEDVIELEQFYQLSHEAILYRLKSENYISSVKYDSLKGPVSRKAMRLGYDDKLYNSSPENKKYFSIGDYVKKAEYLLENELISNGKYEELLLDAFRADIVYNTGIEGEEIDD